MTTILIIEDEKKINQLVYRSLKAVGYQCFQAFYGLEALPILTKEKIDLVVLDIQLPDVDGFALIKSIKGVPVIYLTARDTIADRVKGLNLGAEDYMIKPFAMDELIARVQVVLRRYKQEKDIFQWRELEINFQACVVQLNQQLINLTPQEFSLLEALIHHRNMALSREQLLQLAWPLGYEGDNRTVDIHIQRLRKKLQLEAYLKTVYKLGYRLEVD